MVEDEQGGLRDRGSGAATDRADPMKRSLARAPAHEAFSVSTADPRFDPTRPVTINGYAYAPAAGPCALSDRWPDAGTAAATLRETAGLMRTGLRLPIGAPTMLRLADLLEGRP